MEAKEWLNKNRSGCTKCPTGNVGVSINVIFACSTSLYLNKDKHIFYSYRKYYQVNAGMKDMFLKEGTCSEARESEEPDK